MRNQIDIDKTISRAIIREIGERLRASLKEDEIPASLKAKLKRLDQLDDQSSLPIVPELEIDGEDHAVDYAPPKGARTVRSVRTWASYAWRMGLRKLVAKRHIGRRRSRTAGHTRRWTG
jgi:hypothetical protein